MQKNQKELVRGTAISIKNIENQIRIITALNNQKTRLVETVIEIPVSPQKVQLFPISNRANPTLANRIHKDFLELINAIKKSIENGTQENDLPELLLSVAEYISNLSNIFRLSEEQLNQLVSDFIDLILNSINFGIKIKGIKIPNSIVRSIVGPTLKSIAKCIIHKLMNKQAITKKQAQSTTV